MQIIRDHLFFEVPELITSFFDRGTEDIFNRIPSREACATCPKEIWPVARRKLDQLNAAVSFDSLRIPPGNKLEALRGGRRGQSSIRIIDQYRVCFIWTPECAERVEITDYH
jgi:toxin HigB-1